MFVGVMRPAAYNDEVKTLLESKESYSAADFFEAMPGCRQQTVYSRIRSLVDSGRIEVVGKGLYRKGNSVKPTAHISEEMRCINQLVIDSLPDEPFCLIDSNGNIELQISRRRAMEVHSILKNNGFNVFVSSLVGDAPIITVDGIHVPSVEKTLVDYIHDDRSESFIHRQFQITFENQAVNVSRMLRYAERRGLKEETQSQIEAVDNNRVELFRNLRSYLSKIPVEKAWLFGSFARCEETPESDMDILVDYDKNSQVSILDCIRYKLDIEKVIGREVDLVENGYLKSFAQKSAETDKTLIYARTA